MVYGFYRRHPMAPEMAQQPFKSSPEIPEVDPIETLLEQSLLETPPGEQAYRDLQIPNQQDFAPSKGRKILSVIAAALGGYTDDAGTGMKIGQIIQESPYNNAIARYNEKSKALGAVAANEEKELGRKRLGWNSILDRKERKRAEIERDKDRDLRRQEVANRPPRQLKPEIEYDEKGYGTGRVWDPDAMVMIDKPELKGFRKSSESPTITQKKAANQVALSKGQELMNIFDDLETKYKDVPLIGNPHVGPGQGVISDWLSGMGATDDNVRNLHMLTAELANERLYALSGAQINNKEYERLRRTMASTNKASTAFRADLERFMKFHKAAADGLISENDIDWIPETPTSVPDSRNVPVSTTTPVTTVPPRRHRALRVE